MQPLLCGYIPLQLVQKIRQIAKSKSFFIYYQPDKKTVYQLIKLMMQLNEKDEALIKQLMQMSI